MRGSFLPGRPETLPLPVSRQRPSEEEERRNARAAKGSTDSASICVRGNGTFALASYVVFDIEVVKISSVLQVRNLQLRREKTSSKPTCIRLFLRFGRRSLRCEFKRQSDDDSPAFICGGYYVHNAPTGLARNTLRALIQYSTKHKDGHNDWINNTMHRKNAEYVFLIRPLPPCASLPRKLFLTCFVIDVLGVQTGIHRAWAIRSVAVGPLIHPIWTWDQLSAVLSAKINAIRGHNPSSASELFFILISPLLRPIRTMPYLITIVHSSQL
ncbi:hypothetical protein B0H17DRAFT_687814 [Mycena rosella]|uniref:Uncharacterized protein n=1 Tax=Mycena rosella TaxID=1033263 RepID=A0AAD7DB27_MYCRO|nr:hypothetical protein B0H17DRAFT_687814 [Mycena rosella]